MFEDKLNELQVYETLLKTLPKQNDFFKTDYKDELLELIDFGIHNETQLYELILKHQDAVLKIDAEDLDEFHTKYYIEEYGEEYMKERIENKFWFAYPALLRITLELEFGQKYIDYSANRDKI